jgi:hypothetical protein
VIDLRDEHAVATAAADAAPDRALRSPLFRESALLITLALVGAALEFPLAVALKSLDRSKLGGALPFLGVTLVLTSMVPLALKLSRQLGLPGAPIIAAKLSRASLHVSIRNFLRVTLGYALLAPVAGGVALALVVVPMLLLRPGGMHLPMSPILSAAPGRIAGVGALVAVAAAISEEIQFRLVLFAIVAWIARLFSRNSVGLPGRRAMWCATLVQGYAFGMIHLVPVGGSMFHSKILLLLAGLLMPQTWEGVVFGRLYLRRGLEAAMLAHATMDAALFAIAAVAVLRRPLG